MLKSEKSRIKALALQLIEELVCCTDMEFVDLILDAIRNNDEQTIEEL